MRQWIRRRRGYQALVRIAYAPRAELAEKVGQDGRGLDHVHRMLRASLDEERTAVGALLRTRSAVEHLKQDRALMAQALMAVQAEVRQHQNLPFDDDLLRWS